MRMLDTSAQELRSEFFDLHNRLRPLATYAPVKGFRDKVPLMGSRTEHAHAVVKALVEQLDQHVLPNIPNPALDTALEVELSPAQVAVLSGGSRNHGWGVSNPGLPRRGDPAEVTALTTT